MCGTFAGVEGGNNPLSTYILLELNEDKTRDITTPMPTSTAARPALRIQSTMRERRARLQTPEPRGSSPTTGTATSQALTAAVLPACDGLAIEA